MTGKCSLGNSHVEFCTGLTAKLVDIVCTYQYKQYNHVSVLRMVGVV